MDENFYPEFEIIFAAWTLFAYDYRISRISILTTRTQSSAVLGLDDEIAYIWARPWGWGKAAYLWARAVSVAFIISLMTIHYCESCSLFSISLDLAYTNFTLLNTLLCLLAVSSCQAILIARVYALYFDRKRYLVVLISFYVALEITTVVVVIRRPLVGDDLGNSVPFELYVFNISGLIVDSVLFVLVLAHNVRFRSIFKFRRSLAAHDTTFIASLGRVAGNGGTLLSLLISESIVYYSATLLMYTATFLASRFKPENVVFQNGLVTMMTILTGVLAPKLLLHIRKEYYGGEDRLGWSLESRIRGTMAWHVAVASGQEGTDISSLTTGVLGPDEDHRGDEWDAESHSDAEHVAPNPSAR